MSAPRARPANGGLKADLLDLRRAMERFDDKLDKGNVAQQEIKSQLAALDSRITVTSSELINRIERVEHKSEADLLRENIRQLEQKLTDGEKVNEKEVQSAGFMATLKTRDAVLWMLVLGVVLVVLEKIATVGIGHLFGGK